MPLHHFLLDYPVTAVLVELVDQNNVSADHHQLRLLLSVCRAPDFRQDQEPVKKGHLGHRTLILIVSLIVDFFL